MTVYRIEKDVENFQELHLELRSLMSTVGKTVGPAKLMQFSQHNLSLATEWKPISGHFEPVDGFPESTQIPDITPWRGASFVLSKKALSALKPDLEPYGEFLPVTIDNDPYTIFNCLTLVDADESRSKQVVDGGLIMDVEKLVFSGCDVADKLVFKTEYEKCRSTFCEDRFKEIVEKSGLSGISFSQNLAGF